MLVKVLSENYATYNPKPKLVVVSSFAIGKEALAVTPFLYVLVHHRNIYLVLPILRLLVEC